MFSGAALAFGVGGVGLDVGSGRVISPPHMVFKLSGRRGGHYTSNPILSRFFASHTDRHSSRSRGKYSVFILRFKDSKG